MTDFTDEERGGLYKAIRTRRDVRTRFNGKPVPAERLARILHAAHQAPSVGFSQPWNFILVSDAATRKKIKESFSQEKARSALLVEEPRRSQYASLKLEGIMESYVNVCVTYDPARFGPFVIGRSSMPQTGVYSVCCAIQNMWLAARAEGVGIGWVSILSNQTIRECLRLPPRIEPVAYLCLGYVDGFAAKPDLESAGWLPRLDIGEVVRYEGWEGRPGERWDDLRGALKGSDYA